MNKILTTALIILTLSGCAVANAEETINFCTNDAGGTKEAIKDADDYDCRLGAWE